MNQSQHLTIGDSVYKGIKVLVSFTGNQLDRSNNGQNENQVISSQEEEQNNKDGQEAQQYSLNALSGGQKAVVAACLIFAIQKIDAAPFYIMDEFDSALDPQYCQSIAEQIQKLSRSHVDQTSGRKCPGSQFIMTTFKPHIVDVADAIFEVSFRNQKSQISSIAKGKAMKIMEKQNE